MSFLLWASLPLSYSGVLPQNEKFSNCLSSLRSADLDRPPSPIVTNVFSYASRAYNIPEKFRALAQQVPALDIREDVKESYLLALQDIVGPRNPLNSAISEGWQNAFNKRFIESQNEIKSEDVAIVVHQKEDWQDATAELLVQDEKLKDIPVISLNSPTFSLRSNKLLKRADQVRWSENGELNNLPQSATRFHLMGGWCNKCMSKVVRDVVDLKVQAKQSTPLEIYVYSSLSYTVESIQKPSLAVQLHGKSLSAVLETMDLYNIERSYPGGATHTFPEFVETAHGPAYKITVQGRAYEMPTHIYILAK